MHFIHESIYYIKTYVGNYCVLDLPGTHICIPQSADIGVELQNQIEDAIEWGTNLHLQIVLQMLDPTDGLDDEVYGTVLINGTSLKSLRFNEQGNTKQMIKGQRLYAKKNVYLLISSQWKLRQHFMTKTI